MASTNTIAFLGATGDCAGYCLSLSLKAGYTCRALARTPEKLRESMRTKDVSQDTLDKYLSVVEGNAKDESAVRKVLVANNGEVVDTVVFGIGAAPKLRFHIMPVTMDQPTICRDAMATLLSALQSLNAPKKPLLVDISTTGISDGPRDVALLLIPLYKWALHTPHVDKRETEKLIAGAVGQGTGEGKGERAIRAAVIVRPSLLMNGVAKGPQHVRVGSEEKPAVGYTIRRADVGDWIFEKCVKGRGEGVEGQKVTLTY